MSKMSPRAHRVADQVQRILADLIRREVKDPRLGMVSITGVDVSRDFAYASVYVTVMSPHGLDAGERLEDMGELDRRYIEESVAVLNKAAGYLRSLLGKELSLRTTPALKFKYDESLARGRYMSSLIDRAIAEDSQHAPGSDAPDSDGDKDR